MRAALGDIMSQLFESWDIDIMSQLFKSWDIYGKCEAFMHTSLMKLMFVSIVSV